ncbi:MAG: cyclic nucleotide-binding domain-containing protein [Candidatus Acidiferrales bacterium]
MKVLSAGKKPYAARVGLRVSEGLTLGGLLLALSSMVETTGLSFTLLNLIGTPMLLLSAAIVMFLLVDDLRTRYSLFNTEAYEAGEIIIDQGDPADRAYFIQKGEVEVIREENGKRTRVARMGAGTYFGEMALLKREARRTATIQAATQVELLVLGKENFYRLLDAIPSLHEEFASRSADRKVEGEELPAGKEAE